MYNKLKLMQNSRGGMWELLSRRQGFVLQEYFLLLLVKQRVARGSEILKQKCLILFRNVLFLECVVKASLKISVASLHYFWPLFHYLKIIVPQSHLDQLLKDFFSSLENFEVVLLKVVMLSQTLISILMTHLLGEFATVSQH